MRQIVAVVLSIFAIGSYADTHRQWSNKIAIGASPKPGVFHHLDGSGRKHIAVSEDKVAIVWEDNNDTSPQIYLAIKDPDQQQFGQAVKLSSGSEAYEPAIATIGGSGFVTVYEEDAAVYARLLSNNGLGKAIKLSTAKTDQAGSASIASQGGIAYVVWREKYQNNYRLLITSLKPEKDTGLIVGPIHPIETMPLETPILKPVIAVAGSTVFVAWEDRRAGHTRLLYTFSESLDIQFTAPENLNEFFSARNEYDKGSGVTRLAMASFGEDEVLAAWMDKRRGGAGYGIFSSLGSGSDQSFGPNEKVHGAMGDQQPHYNPAVAGNTAGDFIIAWDDFRNGDLDIWLSSYDDEDEWGIDFSPTVATGAGEQSHASIVLDDIGGLHLIWIERKDKISPTQLWYSNALSK